MERVFRPASYIERVACKENMATHTPFEGHSSEVLFHMELSLHSSPSDSQVEVVGSSAW